MRRPISILLSGKDELPLRGKPILLESVKPQPLVAGFHRLPIRQQLHLDIAARGLASMDKVVCPFAMSASSCCTSPSPAPYKTSQPSGGSVVTAEGEQPDI